MVYKYTYHKKIYNIGVPKKWMVYNGKSMNILLKWMIWGYPHDLGNLHSRNGDAGGL